MLQGSVPFLTKGSFALFLGDTEVLGMLEDRPPGRALIYVMVLSITFQVTMRVLKKFHTHAPQSICSYNQNLRGTFVNNVLNIYGLAALLAINVVTFITLLREDLK